MSFPLRRQGLSLLFFLLTLILSGILLYSASLSARVNFDPRVSTALNFTDNIRLADSGDEEAERIFELMPGFLLDTDSQYVKAILEYDLAVFWYKNNPDSNTYLNKLNGALTAELVPETLFFDANINNSQRTINSTGVVPINDFTLSDNRADVFAYSVSPYFQQRYGNFSSLQARYTYDRTRYTIPEDSTVTGQDPSGFNHRVRLELLSGPQFVGGKWNVSYNLKQFNNTPEKGAITTGVYHDLLLGGSYKLGARLSGLASLGYEYKDSSNRREVQEGPTRSIGASWNPSRRLFMSATLGKRFYGNAKTMTIKYRRRQSVFNLKYSEDVTNIVGVVAEGNIDRNQQVPGSGNSGDPVFPTLEDGIFLRKRLVADFDYNTKRARFNLGAFNEFRDYDDEDKSDQQVLGGSGIFEYNFGKTSYLLLRANWSKTLFNNAVPADVNNPEAIPERIDNLWKGELSLNKNLSTSSKVKLAYSYVRRLSNERVHDYTQNVITANINITFDKL